MGIKGYDVPDGLQDGTVAVPAKDNVFVWEYDQEEFYKIVPTEKDIANIKRVKPNFAEEEVLIEAKQKRYRKNKTIECRTEYEQYEKDGKLDKLPTTNIFHPTYSGAPIVEKGPGLSIVMRPRIALQMMKVEIPSAVIDDINNYIDDSIIPNAKDYSSKLAGQINRNDKSKQLLFDHIDETGGKMLAGLIQALGNTYMNKVLENEEYETEIDKMWTVHSYEGDYNPLHDHSSKTPIGLSCILYLKVPDQIEALPNPTSGGFFGASGSRDGFTYFNWGTHGTQDINMLRPSTEEYVKPEVGTLIMFPSWLKHSVNPFFGEGERRTFSANLNVMKKKVNDNEKTN